MDPVQKFTILTFEGAAVDEWLAGLQFEATVPPEGKDIAIRAVGPTAAQFTQYDMKMWTEWCRRYAYRLWAKAQPKKPFKRRVKPDAIAPRKTKLVPVDPSIPSDLTQAFHVVPVPSKKKRSSK